jgi:hypothetical protein
MSIQPFRSDEMVVIERRTADGKLDFTEPQPPCGGMKFDRVYRLYFQANPGSGPSASWEQLEAWLKSKGWTVRAKTW